MQRSPLLDLLFLRTWWTPGAGEIPWVDQSYRVFNLVEGATWVVLAILVLVRARRHRRSGLEVLYALAFFTFGLTDFRESVALQSWLIWVKLANLIVLVRLRRTVIGRYYPESQLY